MTAAGLGALSGAFGTASLGQIQRRGVVYGGSGIALGGLVLAFALQQTLVTSIVLAFCVAAASQLFITMASALLHTLTPDQLRGRVMGLSTVVVQGGISTGALVIGLFGAVLGIGAAMAYGGGLFALVSAGALARVSALREPATGPTSPAASSAHPVAETPVAPSLRTPSVDPTR
jgi:MFS family permease